MRLPEVVMKLSKAVVLVLSMVLLACLGFACAGASTVKIGMLSPQTGPIAQFAPGFDSAGKVALAELNETHAGEFVFELIVGDSGCDGTTAATAAQTLIDSGVSVIVGAACSGASTAAVAVAAPAGVPMISYASTSPALTTIQDNGHFFRVVPSDAQQAVALTEVAAAAGVSNPAVLYMTCLLYTSDAADE